MVLTEDERGLLRHKAPPRLPAGVSAAAWAEERGRVVNPRLRAFMGCIDHLEAARQSNFTLLHCSPARLVLLLDRIRDVVSLIRREIAPLLSTPSVIPDLEMARSSITLYLATLEESVFRDLDRVPFRPAEDQLAPVRGLLCVAIGKLHAFLMDSQSQLLAADPRSEKDAEFFLARKFPQDVEEAEWLHLSVLRLASIVEEFEKGREGALGGAARAIREAGRAPDDAGWWPSARFLAGILGTLVPRVRECLALDGIRMSEIELLERFLAQVAPDVTLALELREVAKRLAAKLDGEPSVVAQQLLAERLADVLRRVDDRLRDLAAFLPLWEDGVGRRRALVLQRQLGVPSATGLAKTG